MGFSDSRELAGKPWGPLQYDSQGRTQYFDPFTGNTVNSWGGGATGGPMSAPVKTGGATNPSNIDKLHEHALEEARTTSFYGNGGGGEPPVPPPAQLDYSGKSFVYNVGCVKEAYFNPKASFHNLLVKDAKGAIQDSPVKVASSSDLWSGAGKTKGMISLFVPSNPDITMDGIVPATGAQLQPSQWELYSFQFHYNPTSIAMEFAGTPAIDIGLSTSGNDPFNLLGSQGSQSTISFDLVLNRVGDFKYYDENGRIKPEYRNKDIYSPRMPNSEAEEKEIYNKGTMYDVEYLLSTIIGFKTDTALRGTTADVGWLTGRPVRVSLGKSLRYVGSIDGFSINHTMFDVRMVPIFSMVKLTMKRIPDYTGLV